jgi:hypothetical protein
VSAIPDTIVPSMIARRPTRLSHWRRPDQRGCDGAVAADGFPESADYQRSACNALHRQSNQLT